MFDMFPVDVISCCVADCRRLAPRYQRGVFVRVDPFSYRCLPESHPVRGCSPGYRIPDWYRAGYDDPCLCSSFITRAMRVHWLCPPRPLGRRPLAATIDAQPEVQTPPEGRIGDTGNQYNDVIASQITDHSTFVSRLIQLYKKIPINTLHYWT